jgi:PAS domain S-box-containing protein
MTNKKTKDSYSKNSSNVDDTSSLINSDDFANILDSASMGVVRTNSTGDFLYANKYYCDMLGYSQKELLTKNYKEITYESDIKKSNSLLKKVVSGELKEIAFEKKYLHKNGSAVDCEIQIKGFYDAAGKHKMTIAYFRDVTKENESSRKINKLESAFDLFASVILTDPDGVILEVNSKTCEYTGYAEDELIGQPINILNSGYYSNKQWKDFWKIIKSGKTWQEEIRNKKKDGSFNWLFSTVLPKFNNKDEIESYLSIRFDITREKKMYLLNIKGVIEAQEYERERFAMDIHDGLGQTLLAAKMNLSSVNYSNDNFDTDSKKGMINALNLLRVATSEARNISHNLMGKALTQSGLNYAIKEVLRNVNLSEKIKFSLKQNIDETRFDSVLELGVYRVLQEQIKNIIKHSRAKKASIDINLKNKKLIIIVKDNGIGIDFDNENIANGIGLKNMQARIDYLDGNFSINEKIKKGTEIKISVPIN